MLYWCPEHQAQTDEEERHMSSIYSVKLGKIIKEFGLRGGTGYEDRAIETEDVNRPGLQLTGFFDYFDPSRLQVIGKVETTYLTGLTPEARRESFERLLSQDITALIITRGIDPLPWRWPRDMTAPFCAVRRPPPPS